MIINVRTLVFMRSIRHHFQNLINLEISRQIFEKYSNITFHENPTSGCRVVPADGRTDMTKLIVALRSFAKAPENRKQAKSIV
jgi:hypothetical protein